VTEGNYEPPQKRSASLILNVKGNASVITQLKNKKKSKLN